MEALRQRRQRAATTAQQGGVKLRSEREVVIVVGDVQATALCIEREFELAVSERLAIRLAEKWHGNAAIERGVDDAPVDVEEICMAAVAAPFEHFERSEEHTSELQSLMRTSYAVFCLKNKNYQLRTQTI